MNNFKIKSPLRWEDDYLCVSVGNDLVEQQIRDLDEIKSISRKTSFDLSSLQDTVGNLLRNIVYRNESINIFYDYENKTNDLIDKNLLPIHTRLLSLENMPIINYWVKEDADINYSTLTDNFEENATIGL